MTVETPARVRVQAVPVLVVLAVLAQIGYPLASGAQRDAMTVLIVALVAAAALVHAATAYRPHVVVALGAATVVGGFAIEVVGVHTGVPFGHYAYASSLGPEVAGVPVVIAFAWTMLAWPAALAARRLCTSFVARVAVGAWGLAAWDLFLDPQMVAAGHWRWLDPTPHLPGVDSVPLSDYAGWLLAATLVSFAVQHALRAEPAADDRWPLAFYVWTWASSAFALAAFLDLAAAALWGTLAMGTVAVPVARSLARSR